MIPYDDLVAALSAWRARQGLPVSTLGGGGSAAAPQPGSGPHGQPGSGPYGQGGSGPYGQSGSGPARAKAPSVPPPMMEEMAVDDAEMLEEHYENEGDDFSMNFGGGGGTGESTAIGGAPERPTDPNDFTGGGSQGGKGGGRGGRGW